MPDMVTHAYLTSVTATAAMIKNSGPIYVDSQYITSPLVVVEETVSPIDISVPAVEE